MIAVLGRGSSLSKYVSYHSLFDKIYIINDFNVEIDVLGKSTLDNKEIIHVVGAGSVELTLENYKRLNVKHVQFNRLNVKYLGNKNIPVKIKPLPMVLLKRGFPTMPWELYLELKDKFNSHREMCEYVEKTYPKEIIKNIKKSKSDRSWPTTGLLAIDLAIMENSPKELYLFGFDMYATNYLVKNNKPYQNADWDKAKIMKYYLEVIVKEFKDIKFYNSSSVVFNEDNWVNI